MLYLEWSELHTVFDKFFLDTKSYENDSKNLERQQRQDINTIYDFYLT